MVFWLVHRRLRPTVRGLRTWRRSQRLRTEALPPKSKRPRAWWASCQPWKASTCCATVTARRTRSRRCRNVADECITTSRTWPNATSALGQLKWCFHPGVRVSSVLMCINPGWTEAFGTHRTLLHTKLWFIGGGSEHVGSASLQAARPRVRFSAFPKFIDSTA